MSLRSLALLAAGVACFAAGIVVAADRGTAAEAKALLQKAAAHYQAVGRDQAVIDFNNKDGEFVDRDLYLFCYRVEDGVLNVHGANPKLIGRKVGDLTDADGADFTKVIFEGGTTTGSGTVDYKWANPLTKKIEGKSAYYQKIGDEVCAAGYYK